MNDIFGDVEPEDAWDRDDPLAALLDNVRRRLGIAAGDLNGLHLNQIHDELVDVAEDINRTRGGMDPDARTRLDMILTDLEFIGDRLVREF